MSNIAFHKKYVSSFFCAYAFGRKNTNLSVIRTPDCYNTKLIVLFFMRISNFCLRLDAQYVNTHRRLRLFLYFLPSWVSLKNTCKYVDYQCVEHLSCFYMLCTLQTEKFCRTSKGICFSKEICFIKFERICMKNNTSYNLKSIRRGQFRRKNFIHLMQFSTFFQWLRKKGNESIGKKWISNGLI